MTQEEPLKTEASLSNYSIIPLPLKIHRDGYHFPGQQFIWDPLKRKVIVQEKENWKFTISYLLCLVLVSIHSIHYYAETQDVINIVYACTLFEYCSVAIAGFYYSTKTCKEFADFLNGCQVLEKAFREKGVRMSKSRLITFLVWAFQQSGKIFPTVFAVAAFMLPCFPLNYFAAVFAQNDLCCPVGNDVVWWHKIVSAVLSWFVFAASYNIGLTSTTHVLLGVWFQISSLNVYEELLQSKHKSEDIILLYRKMQILNKWFNLSNDKIILFMLNGITCIAALWGFVVVRASAAVMSPPVRVAVLAMLIQLSCMLLLVCGFAGNIHTKSSELFVIYNGVTTNNPNLKRAVKSFLPLKIDLGSSSFIEKTTPLECFEFSLARFIDLLLLEKEWKMN